MDVHQAYSNRLNGDAIYIDLTEQALGRGKPMSDVQWAHEERARLKSDIHRLVGKRADNNEVLGFLPARDRLNDLRRRLAQFESLIGAIDETPHENADAWSPDLGDPIADVSSPRLS